MHEKTQDLANGCIVLGSTTALKLNLLTAASSFVQILRMAYGREIEIHNVFANVSPYFDFVDLDRYA